MAAGPSLPSPSSPSPSAAAAATAAAASAARGLSKGKRTFAGVLALTTALVAGIHLNQRWEREGMTAGPKRDAEQYQARLQRLREEGLLQQVEGGEAEAAESAGRRRR